MISNDSRVKLQRISEFNQGDHETYFRISVIAKTTGLVENM